MAFYELPRAVILCSFREHTSFRTQTFKNMLNTAFVKNEKDIGVGVEVGRGRGHWYKIMHDGK